MFWYLAIVFTHTSPRWSISVATRYYTAFAFKVHLLTWVVLICRRSVFSNDLLKCFSGISAYAQYVITYLALLPREDSIGINVVMVMALRNVHYISKSWSYWKIVELFLCYLRPFSTHVFTQYWISCHPHSQAKSMVAFSTWVLLKILGTTTLNVIWSPEKMK